MRKICFICIIAVLILSLLFSCNGRTEEETTTGGNAETRGTATESSSEPISQTPDPQETGTGSENQTTEDITTGPEIRLGDEEKDWGTYTPIP